MTRELVTSRTEERRADQAVRIFSLATEASTMMTVVASGPERMILSLPSGVRLARFGRRWVSRWRGMPRHTARGTS
jgi:hypothetical protein